MENIAVEKDVAPTAIPQSAKSPNDGSQRPLADTRTQRLLILTAGHGAVFASFASRVPAAAEQPSHTSTPWLLWCALFMGVSAYGLLRCYFGWRAAEDTDGAQFKRQERIAVKWLASSIATIVGLTVALAAFAAFGVSVVPPG